MTHNVTLKVTSLLSALLFAFHWSDEISRGMEVGTLSAFGGIVILVVWLSGTLVLGDRRSGYIISLIGGILGLGVLILHMSGKGMLGGRITPNSPGAFFWALTLVMLGTTSTLSAILAVQAMRATFSSRSAGH
jgi:hypothetical protein